MTPTSYVETKLLRAVMSRWNLDTLAGKGGLEKHALVLRDKRRVWVKPFFR